MTKRKKVLLDLYNLATPNCGFGQIAINYAKLFAEVQRAGKADFDIAFLLPNTYRHKSLKEFDGVECYFKETTLHHMFHIIPNRLPKVDLWHSINQFCEVYPQSPNTKLLFTIHDLNFLFEESPKTVALLSKRMQQRIDKASCVTFISNFSYQLSRLHLNLRGKDTRVIYNGVEDLIDKPMEKPFFIKEGKPFFFCIGQFLPKKNFHLLLDVMKHFPEKELYICGESHTSYGLQMFKRINDERIKNVTIVNTIPDIERVWLFANCEAYLFPSIGEGFGLPLIEAMQFGKPVFCSDAQSLPEIGNGYAYTWHSLDTNQMVQTIKENLDNHYKDPERIQKMKDYARSFSYKKHIDSYLALYQELLGS